MTVSGTLNDGGMKTYEVKQGLSKLKDAKAPGLDQCAVEFLKIVAWLCRSYDCSFVMFRTRRVPI